MKYLALNLLALSLCAACTPAQNNNAAPAAAVLTYETIGAIENVPASLIAADAKIENLGGDYGWSEGPVWVKAGGYLLFTDVPGNTMYKFKEGEGTTSFLSPSGLAGDKPDWSSSPGANGLYAFDKDHIIVADHGNRTLYKMNVSTKQKTVLADKYESKKFHSPNDAVLAKSGVIYFTDPPYGLKGQDDSAARELDFNGVYALFPNGKLTVIDTALTRPNGVILSPDERTLYVANSDSNDAKWMAYKLDAGGLPASRRELLNVTADVKAGLKGLPDGMAVDTAGNLFATGPGGVLIISPAGERLGVISTGTAIANCTFGGDGNTLYMTSHSFLARVETKAKGLGF